MIKKTLQFIARFRTWIVNLLLVIVTLMPEVLNSPEVLAVIPHEYQRWFLIAAFAVNIWMRPRPAVVPSDLKGGGK